MKNDFNKMVKIEQAGFSVRTTNSLQRANLVTVGDICAIPEEEVKKIRNLGDKGFVEIKQKLGEYGLMLMTQHEFAELAQKIKESSTDMSVNPILISEVGFCVHTYIALKKAGITSLQEIADILNKGNFRVDGIKVKNLDEIKIKLYEYGL